MDIKKVFTLGSLADPLAYIPKPDAGKVANKYFGKDTPTNPWIDANDLTEIVEKHTYTICNNEVIADHGSVSTYKWRDTDMRVVVDNTTNEIVDIYEVR